MIDTKRRSLGLLFTIVMATVISRLNAQELPRARPEDMGFSSQRLDYIDRFYADKVKRGEMAGIVTLISRHGKVVHFNAVGYADVEKKRKMETDTLFRLYSMTKPITSVALMMLYEEGRFQMNEPLSKYIPEFGNLKVLRAPDAPGNEAVAPVRSPTIQDVLRHTAGFSHGAFNNAVDAEYRKANLFDVDMPLTEMIDRLAKIPLLEQPGKKFIYSMGPDVQARLVEVLSGIPFDEFLKRRLFRPLGMKDAEFWVPPDKASRLAAVYWMKNGKLTPLDQAHGHPNEGNPLYEPGLVNSYEANHRHKSGSYGLVSTAEDYWRFAQMLLDGGRLSDVRILSPQVVRFITRDHLGSIASGDASVPGAGFGLGFAVIRDPAAAGFMSSEGTFYWTGAADTNFWVDPKEDVVMVAMTQDMDGAPGSEVLEPQLRTLVYSALLN